MRKLIFVACLVFLASQIVIACSPELGTITDFPCGEACDSCGWTASVGCSGGCPCGYNCQFEANYGGKIVVGMSYDCDWEEGDCGCTSSNPNYVHMSGKCGCFNF